MLPTFLKSCITGNLCKLFWLWILCWLYWWNVAGLIMTLMLFLFFRRLSPLLTLLLYLLPPSLPQFLFCILYCPVWWAIVSNSSCHVYDLGIGRSLWLNSFLFFKLFWFFNGRIWLLWYFVDLIWRARRNISFSKFVDSEGFEEASTDEGDCKETKFEVFRLQLASTRIVESCFEQFLSMVIGVIENPSKKLDLFIPFVMLSLLRLSVLDDMERLKRSWSLLKHLFLRSRNPFRNRFESKL